MQHIDWDAVQRETIAHLERLIAFDTTNPPGNELQAARWLDDTLRGAGIETHLFEPAPGRGVLVARVRGNGSRRPVLLVAHTDVVGVQRQRWTSDPFVAAIRDGYLYGRGAIDDKGMLAVNVMTMLLLKREVVERGGTLARDVVLVANADEEAGGKLGMEWLVEQQPELIGAEFAINEGGRIRVVNGKPLYVAVQCAEKVSHVVVVTARGPGGHASVPVPDNAVFRLARALVAIERVRQPVHLLPTTREFFAELARVWPDAAEARAMADVGSGEGARVERGAAALAPVPSFDAVLRAGVSPAIVAGGNRSNVIPTDARATLNVRTLPGQSLDDVLARLREAVNDPMVDIAATDRGEDAPPSDSATPMFAAIAEAARELDPSLAVVPYLSTGATDSAKLRRFGVAAYGVLPFPLAQEDEARMHGDDERIPLEALAFGTRLVFGAVSRMAVDGRLTG